MKRVLPLLLVLGSGLMWSASACSSDEADDDSLLDASNTTSGGSSSSSGRSGLSSSSSGSGGVSSSSGGGSTSSSSGGSSSSSGGMVDGGALGQECVFTGNYGCNSDLRCECEGDVNCTCQPGARGTGAFNAPCDDSNDCASGLCYSGPAAADGGPRPYYCTQFCQAEDECEAPLNHCNLQYTTCVSAP